MTIALAFLESHGIPIDHRMYLLEPRPAEAMESPSLQPNFDWLGNLMATLQLKRRHGRSQTIGKHDIDLPQAIGIYRR